MPRRSALPVEYVAKADVYNKKRKCKSHFSFIRHFISPLVLNAPRNNNSMPYHYTNIALSKSTALFTIHMHF